MEEKELQSIIGIFSALGEDIDNDQAQQVINKFGDVRSAISSITKAAGEEFTSDQITQYLNKNVPTSQETIEAREAGRTAEAAFAESQADPVDQAVATATDTPVEPEEPVVEEITRTLTPEGEIPDGTTQQAVAIDPLTGEALGEASTITDPIEEALNKATDPTAGQEPEQFAPLQPDSLTRVESVVSGLPLVEFDDPAKNLFVKEQAAAEAASEETLILNSIPNLNRRAKEIELGSELTDVDKENFQMKRGARSRLSEANKEVLDLRYGEDWVKNFSNNSRLVNNLTKKEKSLKERYNSSTNDQEKKQIEAEYKKNLSRIMDAMKANATIYKDENFKTYARQQNKLRQLNEDHFKFFPEDEAAAEVIKKIQADTDIDFEKQDGFMDNAQGYLERRAFHSMGATGRLIGTVKALKANIQDAIGDEEGARKTRVESIRDVQKFLQAAQAKIPTRYQGSARELTLPREDGSSIVFDQTTEKVKYTRNKFGNIVELSDKERERIDEEGLVSNAELDADFGRILNLAEGSAWDMAIIIGVNRGGLFGGGARGITAGVAGGTAFQVYGSEYASQLEKGNPNAALTAGAIATTTGLLEAYIGGMESRLAGAGAKKAATEAAIEKAKIEVLENVARNIDDFTIQSIPQKFAEALRKSGKGIVSDGGGDLMEELLQQGAEKYINNIATNEKIHMSGEELTNTVATVSVLTFIPGASQGLRYNQNDITGIRDQLVYAATNFDAFNDKVNEFVATGDITEEKGQEVKDKIFRLKEELEVHELTPEEHIEFAPLIVERNFIDAKLEEVEGKKSRERLRERRDAIQEEIYQRAALSGAIKDPNNPTNSPEPTDDQALQMKKLREEGSVLIEESDQLLKEADSIRGKITSLLEKREKEREKENPSKDLINRYIEDIDALTQESESVKERIEEKTQEVKNKQAEVQAYEEGIGNIDTAPAIGITGRERKVYEKEEDVPDNEKQYISGRGETTVNGVTTTEIRVDVPVATTEAVGENIDAPNLVDDALAQAQGETTPTPDVAQTPIAPDITPVTEVDPTTTTPDTTPTTPNADSIVEIKNGRSKATYTHNGEAWVKKNGELASPRFQTRLNNAYAKQVEELANRVNPSDIQQGTQFVGANGKTYTVTDSTDGKVTAVQEGKTRGFKIDAEKLANQLTDPNNKRNLVQQEATPAAPEATTPTNTTPTTTTEQTQEEATTLNETTEPLTKEKEGQETTQAEPVVENQESSKEKIDKGVKELAERLNKNKKRKINDVIQKTLKYLKPTFKKLGITVIEHVNRAKFNSKLRSLGVSNPESYQGYYDPLTKEIIIDITAVDSKVALHEAVHPFITDIMNNNRGLYDSFAQEIATEEKFQEFKEFGEQYAEDAPGRDVEESIVESIASNTLSRLLDNESLGENQSILDYLKSLYRRMLSAIGFNTTSVTALTKDNKDIVSFSKAIADALYQGKGITTSAKVNEREGKGSRLTKNKVLAQIRANRDKFEGISIGSVKKYYNEISNNSIELTTEEIEGALGKNILLSTYGTEGSKQFVELRKDTVEEYMSNLGVSAISGLKGYEQTTAEKQVERAFNKGLMNKNDPSAIDEIISKVTAGDSLGIDEQIGLAFWFQEWTRQLGNFQGNDIASFEQRAIIENKISEIGNTLSTARSRAGRDLGLAVSLTRGVTFKNPDLIKLFKKKSNGRSPNQAQERELKDLQNQRRRLEEQLDSARKGLDKDVSKKIQLSVEERIKEIKKGKEIGGARDFIKSKVKKAIRKSQNFLKLRDAIVTETKERTKAEIKALIKGLNDIAKASQEGRGSRLSGSILNPSNPMKVTPRSDRIFKINLFLEKFIKDYPAKNLDELLEAIDNIYGSEITNPITREEAITALLLGSKTQINNQIKVLKQRKKELNFYLGLEKEVKEFIRGQKAPTAAERSKAGYAKKSNSIEKEFNFKMHNVLRYALGQVNKTITSAEFANIIDKEVGEIKGMFKEWRAGRVNKSDLETKISNLLENNLLHNNSSVLSTIEGVDSAINSLVNGDYSMVEMILPFESDSKINSRIAKITNQISDNKALASAFIDAHTRPKWKRVTEKGVNTFRDFKLFMDASYVFVQGGIGAALALVDRSTLLGPANAIRQRSLDPLKQMTMVQFMNLLGRSLHIGWKDFWTDQNAGRAYHKSIIEDPLQQIRELVGLRISDPDGGFFDGEGLFMDSFVDDMWFFKGAKKSSNQAMTAFINGLRANMFDRYYDLNKDRGTPMTLDELKTVANKINVVTGGIKKDKWESALRTSSLFFIAPRLYASMIVETGNMVYDPFIGTGKGVLKTEIFRREYNKLRNNRISRQKSGGVKLSPSTKETEAKDNLEKERSLNRARWYRARASFASLGFYAGLAALVSSICDEDHDVIQTDPRKSDFGSFNCALGKLDALPLVQYYKLYANILAKLAGNRGAEFEDDPSLNFSQNVLKSSTHDVAQFALNKSSIFGSVLFSIIDRQTKMGVPLGYNSGQAYYSLTGERIPSNTPSRWGMELFDLVVINNLPIFPSTTLQTIGSRGTQAQTLQESIEDMNKLKELGFVVGQTFGVNYRNRGNYITHGTVKEYIRDFKYTPDIFQNKKVNIVKGGKLKKTSVPVIPKYIQKLPHIGFYAKNRIRDEFGKSMLQEITNGGLPELGTTTKEEAKVFRKGKGKSIENKMKKFMEDANKKVYEEIKNIYNIPPDPNK